MTGWKRNTMLSSPNPYGPIRPRINFPSAPPAQITFVIQDSYNPKSTPQR